MSSASCRTTGGDVARQGIGVLLELAGSQVEGPDVEDVPVAGHVRVDRLRGIRGGRREDDRLLVDELGPRIVVRAEGQLRLLQRVEVEAEQLSVSTHPREVDDRRAIRREGRRIIAKVVAGEVGQLLRVEVREEDVPNAVAQRRKDDALAVRAYIG